MRTLSAAHRLPTCLALAREQQPDVVLMDLRLPDLDGGEAARRLGPTSAPGGSPSSR